MGIHSLIKTPNLTRELSIELSGMGAFMSDQLQELPKSTLFQEELEEFDRSSTKLKLHSFLMLYNDFEGVMATGENPNQTSVVRKDLRLKFPYLSSLDQMKVYFLSDEGQSAVISSFFLSEVISRVMDIYGQSKKLKSWLDKAHSSYAISSAPNHADATPEMFNEIINLPTELYHTLSSSLGKNWVLNLYQRTFDKLQSQYSNLSGFAQLQANIEQIFTTI